jgi:VanZ family protein
VHVKLRVDLRYSILTAAYLASIYGLSAIPDLGTPKQEPLVVLLLNLGHAPLFAGLGFCVLKSAFGTPNVSAPYVLAFVASAACAALDEWHQSFVPGRHCSLGDLLVDLAGIGGVLLFLRLDALLKERCPEGIAPVCCVRQP